MSVLNALSVSRAPIAALAAVGVFWGAFAALVPEIKATVGASDAQMGLALIMSATGGMAAMYLAPRIGDALARFALPVAGALLCLGPLYLLRAGDVPGLALALLGMGASVALLDILANVRISVLEERHRLHLMNLNHAMFSFAFAGSAFLTGIARKAGWEAAQILPLVALAVLLLALSMLEGRRWRPAPAAEDGAPQQSPWGLIVPTGAILFASFVCENATEAWSALHIERTLGGPVGEGGFGPMMLGLTMGIGRLSGHFAAARLGDVALVLWSAALGAVGAVLVAAAPVPGAAIAGVAVMGFGFAVIVPTANSILGRLVRPDLRSFAISRAWMLGFTGFFIGPTAIGFISEHAGLRVAFLAVALIAAGIIPCVLALRRRGA